MPGHTLLPGENSMKAMDFRPYHDFFTKGKE